MIKSYLRFGVIYGDQAVEIDEVAELQWKRMVDDLRKEGSLKNCMAICDVSGSMFGTPMEVSVALGMLISELSEDPWKGKLITFSEKPQLHNVQGDNLMSKTWFVTKMNWDMNTDFQKVFDRILEVAVKGNLKPEQMRFMELSEDPWKGKLITFSEKPQLHNVQGDNLMSKTWFVTKMNWDMNTDFQKVFDRILEVAVEGNLKPEQMIKRLFVFSDMEFDQASLNPWESDYQAIVRKYTEKGYGSVVPQIVFWNLRESIATPVMGKKQGVALVGGFSKNMIKMFLNNDGEINPEIIMEAAISRKEYQKLVIVD
ncbi:hypothetical protein Ddye_031674 [Dipteronia dyeriana]|uniref:DUF7788 domain-containing protein n=1 Tax=Dipteronia dyeriana TaxID=168575 RepID=A0AAD9TJD9_9ROSI|nr:hypothetical protein Ddye_031674 [Dipteronia dyeriana]